jgi:NitT/TauT family transport system permease protein
VKPAALGRVRVVLYPLAALAVLLVVMQVLVQTHIISPLTMPTPIEVFQSFGKFGRVIIPQMLATLGTSLLGFSLAAVLGLIGAAFVAEFKILNITIMPILLVIQSLPKVALAPLFVFWLGFGLTSRVSIAFLTALFPIMVSTAVGLTRVPPELMELSQSLRASRLKAFFKIKLPLGIPSYLAGMRIGAPLAVVGAVVGEFVSGANGMGYVVKSATLQGLLPLAFVGIIVLTVMGYLLYLAVAGISKLVTPWAVTHGR